ncbi:MAG: glycosyltransferase [Thermodesulfobacteriota bacterium]
MPAPVSVVVASRNGAGRLAGLLPRLLAQVVALPGAQVVVCDNGSGDGTARMAEQAFAARPEVPAQVVAEPAPGKARALNAALARCSGEILAFLDDDVIPSPGWLSSVVSAFSNKNLDGLGGRVLPYWDGPPPWWFTPAVAGFTPVHDRGDRELAYSLPGPLPVGAAMAIRREAVERLGPFDPELGHRDGVTFGAEESEWFFRAMTSGFRFAYRPEAWVLHPMEAFRPKAAMRRRAFAQGRGAARMAAAIVRKGLPLRRFFRGPAGGREAGKTAFFYELRFLLAMGMGWEMVQANRQPASRLV